MAIHTLGQQAEKKAKVDRPALTKSDRCDADCPAQAHVMVIGLEGELLFCAHHYNEIMAKDSSREAMESFAIETIKQEEAA